MRHSFTPPTEPGFRFSDGKLRIFQADAVMVIAGWAELAAVRKSAANPRWESFRPAFRLVKPYRPSAAAKAAKKKAPACQSKLAEPALGQTDFGFFNSIPAPLQPIRQPTLTQQRKKAFDSFRFSMPKEVARAVEPFPSDQWPLLLMLLYDPSALDLALSNPALAYLLSLKLNGNREMVTALKCGTLRQREILGYLGFPGTNGSVNLFRKIEPASVNADNWSQLLQFLRNPDEEIRQRLAHLSAINLGVVEILLNREAATTAGQRLLQEVAEDPVESHRARVVHLITNTLAMQDAIQPRQPVRQFPDRKRLEQVHSEVLEAYRERQQRIAEAQRSIAEARQTTGNHFGIPPIPSQPGQIEALTSPEALVDEGNAMGNCVATYAKKVARGDLYIYRVLTPVRSTLSIVRSSGGIWRISELAGRFNKLAEDPVESFVLDWLRRYQIEA